MISPLTLGAIDQPHGGGDPNYSQVVLLMHGDDQANGSTTITNTVFPTRGLAFSPDASVTISTTSPLFGPGCILFAGTGIQAIGSTSDYIPGTNDFTLEGAYNTPTPGQTAALYDFRSSLGVGPGPQLGLFGGQYFIFNAGGLFQLFGTVSTSAYDQIAYCRVAGVGYCFQAGVLLATVADTADYSTDVGTLFIGEVSNTSNPYAGRMDELRITNGTGRYTTNYTPAIAPFPNF